MKKYIYIITLFFLFSCTDGFEDLNIDPSQPSEVSTSFLLTSAQKRAMDWYWDEWMNGRQGMQYAQYWSSNQYTDESRYLERVAINNNAWTAYYAIVLADLDEIIRLNTETPENTLAAGDPANQIAVALVLKVWMVQVMTDIWGDIPYSEALLPDEFRSPAYDTQEQVYDLMFSDLNEAISLINVNEDGFTSGDVIYGGDMEKWARFANSLKMRLGIRVADVKPDLASQAISEAITAGVFTSNDDNALFQYLPSIPNNNPLANDRITREDFAVSEALVNTLLSRNDPRIAAYAEPAANTGEYVGMPYGMPQAVAGTIAVGAVSQPSGSPELETGILAHTAPGVYMDYAEVEFILAEAAARGIGGVTDAEAHYNAGIRASMLYWNNISDMAVTEAEIDAYVAANPLDAANWRQSIGVQKWIALYGQGLQGWIEFRRLDFTGVLRPAVDPFVQLNTPAGVPVRTRYPTDEAQLNLENYEEASQRMGGDVLNTRVWWDVN